MSESAAGIAERVARESYGRLLAIVAGRTGDIAAAEDALADAFAAALSAWPARGVPRRPEAWLVTVARRAAGHRARHARVVAAALPGLAVLAGITGTPPDEPVPDERLKLLFVCAHPAIEPAARTPLMLQTVLGLDAARIARAFIVAPATMAQRLVRAKRKIRLAGVPFAVPAPDELPARLTPVLDAIYAAFTSDWDDIDGAAGGPPALADEAIFLARLVTDLAPGEPEPKGLLALMLHCEARRAARRTPEGAYVPLDAQDPAGWNAAMLDEAEQMLRAAAAARRFGRFQTEAAIQSIHVEAVRTGATPVATLLGLYDRLAEQAPTLGGLVARAAAYGKHRGPATGLALLDALPREALEDYQPYWAARAHLLAASGLGAAASGAAERAAALTQDSAVRAFLRRAVTRDGQAGRA